MRHGDPCDFGCCYWGRLGGGETSGRSGDKDDARAGPPFAPPRLRRSTAFGFRRSSTRSSTWPVALSASSLPSWNRVTGAFEALERRQVRMLLLFSNPGSGLSLALEAGISAG